MAKILLLEDEKMLADVVLTFLSSKKHQADHFDDGLKANVALLGGGYDLAILDWQVPQKSGVEVCSAAREAGLTLPILMLTNRSQSKDKVQGLNVGADDYLTKPFELEELEARLQALLRRPSNLSGNHLRCGDIVISLGAATISKAGEPIELAPAEYALLEFLMRNPGRIFSADELLNHVWASDSDATYLAVATCIRRLRMKLAVEGKDSIIKTAHGTGYKLEE
jgi:DNA-binding response OmpR family regulator